jgi:DNA polymerase IV
MRVLVLWFPEFVVDVEREWARVPRGSALVVGGRAHDPGVVVAACAAARAAGIRPGMPLPAAAALAPAATFVPGILDRYAEAASLLDECVRRVCPRVAWRSIDELVVDVGDLPPTSRGLSPVADALREALRAAWPFTVAAGLAESEVAARVAARLAAPAGLVQVLPGYAGRFMAPLGLDWLPGLPTSACRQLQAQGVETIGEFALCAPDVAAACLGPDAGALQLAATGVDASRAVATSLPRSITRTQETPAARSLADVTEAVEAMTEAVADRLVDLDLCARSLTVRVVGGTGRFRSRGLILPAGRADRTSLRQQAGTLAGRLWRFVDVPRRVSVVASGLAAQDPQLRLFGMPRQVDADRAS